MRTIEFGNRKGTRVRFGIYELFKFEQQRFTRPSEWEVEYKPSYYGYQICNYETGKLLKRSRQLTTDQEASRVCANEVWTEFKSKIAQTAPLTNCLVKVDGRTMLVLDQDLSTGTLTVHNDRTQFPGDMEDVATVNLAEVGATESEPRPDSYRYIQHLRVSW